MHTDKRIGTRNSRLEQTLKFYFSGHKAGGSRGLARGAGCRCAGVQGKGAGKTWAPGLGLCKRN